MWESQSFIVKYSQAKDYQIKFLTDSAKILIPESMR